MRVISSRHVRPFVVNIMRCFDQRQSHPGGAQRSPPCLHALLEKRSPGALVQQQRFTHMLDFSDGAAEIEGLGEDDLEDLSKAHHTLANASPNMVPHLGQTNLTFCTLIL